MENEREQIARKEASGVTSPFVSIPSILPFAEVTGNVRARAVTCSSS